MNISSKKVFGLIIFILLGANLLIFFSPNDQREKVISGASAQDVSEKKNSTSTTLKNYAVKDGDTFASIMEKFGFSREKSNQILREAKDVYDFSNIEKGNLFQFALLSDGRVQKIKYDKNREKQIVLERNGTSTFDFYSQDIPYDYEIKKAETKIKKSLFSSATRKGIPKKIILELAEIFAWDIDFAADIRKNDSFSVVYRELIRNGNSVGPGRVLAAKFKNQGKTHYAFYFEKEDGNGKYYNREGKSVQKQFLKSPLNYSYISSSFSYNRLNPVTRTYGTHRAVDYAAPPGTQVYSTGQGRVSYAGWGTGKGLYVKVKHGGVYSTTYAHLSGLADGIRTGVSVSQGQVIGYVGSTGQSTGSHLHYVMKKYGRHINPLTYDLPEGEPLSEKYMSDFQKVVEKYKPMLE